MVVRLAGELDMPTWPDLQELLDAALSDRPAMILLDLSDVEFIDAHSIGMIVAAWSTARHRGRSLRVEGVHGVPRRLFVMLGLQPLLGTLDGEGVGGQDGGGH